MKVMVMVLRLMNDDGDFGDCVGGEDEDDCCGPEYTTFIHHGILQN